MLRVEKKGIPKYLYSFAFDHPAFYGLFACIIAMATGITHLNQFFICGGPKTNATHVANKPHVAEDDRKSVSGRRRRRIVQGSGIRVGPTMSPR